MSRQEEDVMLEMRANAPNSYAQGVLQGQHPYHNPAHEDMINAGRLRDAPGDAFHGDHLNFSRVEVASVCCCMFALLACVGIINALNPSGMHLVQKWADKKWIKGHCQVEAVGIAYRGNCHTDVTLTMTTYNRFKECMGLPQKLGVNVKDTWKKWQHSQAGACAARGDLAFQMDTGEVFTGNDEGEIIGRSSFPSFSEDPRSLPNALEERFLPGARIDCHNNYLPWALLHIDRDLMSLIPGTDRFVAGNNGSAGIKRCAYEFGASQPSLSGDWEEIMDMVTTLRQERDSLAHGGVGKVACWVLQSDDCVVAFMDQRELVAAAQRRNTLSTVSGLLCGTLAVTAMLLACCWHLREQGWCHRCPETFMSVVCCEPPGGFHRPLPTQDPDGIVPGIPLTDRVRQAVTAAAANLRNSDLTPGTPVTVWSTREVQHNMAAEHNMAADFLNK